MSEYEIQGRFEVDISNIDADLNALDNSSSNVFRRIAQRLRIETRELLVSTFEEALADLEEDQMGSAVQHSMLSNVARLPIAVLADPNGVAAEIDFNDLGTRGDLEAGFHYHALLRGKGFLELPYAGQEMHNDDDPDTRYEFVQAMMNGDFFETAKGYTVSTEGLWEQTQEVRATFWGNKSPAWLYLEFGQEEWDPTIEPKDITGQFQEAFSELGAAIFEEEWTAAIEVLEEYENEGFAKDITGGAKGRFRNEFGQFLPKP